MIIKPKSEAYPFKMWMHFPHEALPRFTFSTGTLIFEETSIGAEVCRLLPFSFIMLLSYLGRYSETPFVYFTLSCLCSLAAPWGKFFWWIFRCRNAVPKKDLPSKICFCSQISTLNGITAHCAVVSLQKKWTDTLPDAMS